MKARIALGLGAALLALTAMGCGNQRRLDRVVAGDVVHTPALVAAPLTEATLEEVGTRLVIRLENRLGAPYTLTGLSFAVDGRPVFERPQGEEALPDIVLLYDGPIEPGEHVIETELIYDGRAVGPFTYVRGYTFNVSSVTPFLAERATSTVIDLVASSRGPGATLEARPRVDYAISVTPFEAELETQPVLGLDELTEELDFDDTVGLDEPR